MLAIPLTTLALLLVFMPLPSPGSTPMLWLWTDMIGGGKKSNQAESEYVQRQLPSVKKSDIGMEGQVLLQTPPPPFLLQLNWSPFYTTEYMYLSIIDIIQ